MGEYLECYGNQIGVLCYLDCCDKMYLINDMGGCQI